MEMKIQQRQLIDREIQALNVRIPKELYNKLKAKAKSEHKSLALTVTQIFEQVLEGIQDERRPETV